MAQTPTSGMRELHHETNSQDALRLGRLGDYARGWVKYAAWVVVGVCVLWDWTLEELMETQKGQKQ
jgi:hypothetical protein